MPNLAALAVVGGDASRNATLTPINRAAGITNWAALSNTGSLGNTSPGFTTRAVFKKKISASNVMGMGLKLVVYDQLAPGQVGAPSYVEYELTARVPTLVSTLTAQDALFAMRGLLFDPSIVKILTTEEDLY